MKEIFYEESAEIQNRRSASTKYNVLKTVSILSYVLLCVWIMLVFVGYEFSGNILVHIIIVLIPAIMFFLSGFFLGKLKNKFYVDYDYTFVTGSIRIAKVIKNIKRRFVIKFDASDIEKLGKYGSDTYHKYEKMPGIAKFILTSNVSASDGKEFYYLVVNVDGVKKLLILECTETLMVNILKFANKTIIEEDFK